MALPSTKQRKDVLEDAGSINMSKDQSGLEPSGPQISSNSFLLDFIGSVPEQLTSAVAGGALSAYSTYDMVKSLSHHKPARAGIMGGLTLAGAALMYRGLKGLIGEMAYEANEMEGEVTNVAADARNKGVKVEESVVVDRTPQVLYEYWRDIENLPSIMRHLKSVVAVDDIHSHWMVKGPMGTSVEWDAEIYTDQPGAFISWRSLPGAEVDNAGSVHFDELGDGHGTTVTVILNYDPPAGKLGALVAELMGEDPAKQIRHDLRRFKKSMESQETFGAGDNDLEDRSDGHSGKRR